MKCVSVGTQVFHAERETIGWTDHTTKLIVDFCSYEIASTAYKICCRIQNPTGFSDDFNARYVAE